MAYLVDITTTDQLQAERGFLVCCTTYPVYAVKQCGWLDPAILMDKSVRSFWEHLTANITPNMNDKEASEVVGEAIVRSNVGGDMLKWSEGVFHGATASAYAKEIVRRHYLSEASSYLTRAAQAIDKNDDVELRSILSDAASINLSDTAPDNSAVRVNETLKQQLNAGIKSIRTGIPELDEAIGGLETATEILIAGRPSMGKTALGFQIARNGASQKKRVVFFSLEMSEGSLWARAICPLVGVEWRDVIGGNITPAQLKQLGVEGDNLASTYGEYLIIDDRASHTTESIWRAVSVYKPDLIIVDHLKLLKDKGDNDVKRLGECCDRLKMIAKFFGIPVVVLVQLNRALEARIDKRPQLSDLRGSGEIEEYGDVIVMLHSEYYFDPMKAQGTTRFPTELWVRKFRNGKRNQLIDLVFDARQEWFVSPTP